MLHLVEIFLAMLVKLQSNLYGYASMQGEVGSAVDRAGRKYPCFVFSSEWHITAGFEKQCFLDFDGEAKRMVEFMENGDNGGRYGTIGGYAESADPFPIVTSSRYSFMTVCARAYSFSGYALTTSCRQNLVQAWRCFLTLMLYQNFLRKWCKNGVRLWLLNLKPIAAQRV